MNIAIIGAGNVGSHIASAIIHKNLPVTLYLVDMKQEYETAQVLDLKDTLLFSPRVRVLGADFGDEVLSSCDIFIVTAGAHQHSGEDRCDLLTRNVDILQNIKDRLGPIKKSAMVIMVANPVDVLTYIAYKVFDLPSTQVFGTGTLLDTARLRWRIAQYLGKDVSEVTGYVVGEHGDSQCVVWSSVTQAEVLQENERRDLAHATMHQAYDIIAGKGATFFGIGAATADIVDNIVTDKKSEVPLSCILSGDYGLRNIAIGVPAIIGRQGIEEVVELRLTQEEQDQLNASAAKISELIDLCGLPE